MKTLLSTNAKLLKHNGEVYLNTGMALAPHSLSKVADVCPEATPACKSACVLWFTGRTVMQNVRQAMIERTQLLVNDRAQFESRLNHELDLHARRAKRAGLIATARLNVASDLDWRQIVVSHPSIRFYDYTKVRSRALESCGADWPSNYWLTYSLNDSQHSAMCASQMLARGRNVAVVFSTRYFPQRQLLGTLPLTWEEHIVVDGDVLDVRLPEVDGRGRIVGLRFKGSLRRRANAIRNGFCVDVGSGL